MGIFLEGEDSRGDHGLGRLVELRFKAPPGTTSSSITTHTSSGQRSRASWASQPQKSVISLPCPGGRTTKSTKDMWWHWEKKIFGFLWLKQYLTVQYANECSEFNKQKVIHIYDKVRVKCTRDDNNNVRLTAFILC